MPQYGHQVSSTGKDFLRGGKDIFQFLDASIHLEQPQLYTSNRKNQVVVGDGYTGDEYPGLADINRVKLILTPVGYVGREMTTDSTTGEALARAGPLPRDQEHFVVRVIALCCLKTGEAWP